MTYDKRHCDDCGWHVVAFTADDSRDAYDLHREQRHDEPRLTGLDRIVAEWRAL